MSAATHEAAHACAVHVLHLARVLRPGGVAVGEGGGICALGSGAQTGQELSGIMVRCASDDKVKATPALCGTAIEAARTHPQYAPRIVQFLLSGSAAEASEWQGRFTETITVRLSADYRSAVEILIGLIGSRGYTAESFASEAVYDALERAVLWCNRPDVRPLIDAAAAEIEDRNAVSWPELQTIFRARKPAALGRVSGKRSRPTGTGLAAETVGASARQRAPWRKRKKPAQK